MFAQVLLAISGFIGVSAAVMMSLNWQQAESAPQQAVVCALALAVAGIPYFIARAVAAAQMLSELRAIRRHIAGDSATPSPGYDESGADAVEALRASRSRSFAP